MATKAAPFLDIFAPLHHGEMMRLTINLDEDLYAIAKGLAQAEEVSISEAINRLLRRRVEPVRRGRVRRRHALSALPVSQGRRLVTVVDVRKAEQEEDLS